MRVHFLTFKLLTHSSVSCVHRNLMKRAENCVDCKINHITIRNDALVFEFAKSKGHQNGEEHVGPWHVYPNPEEPHLCLFMALARYLFTYPQLLNEDASLFQGTSQYNRYSKLFLQVVTDNKTELQALGVEDGDLGTHSCRKGVATMVAAGCTVSPPIVSICVRAGWVMGGVKDRYLKRESAGDQYVGRCAAGLDQLSKRFAISPPYFDFTGISEAIERVRLRKRMKEWLHSRILEEGNLSASSQHIVWSLFASICYHYDYLTSNLHEECSFRASPFFKDIPEEFINVAKVAFPWDSTVDTPKLTGVPPHVLLMAEIEELKIKFTALQVTIKNDMKDALDERGVGGNEYHTNSILQAIKLSETRMLSSVQYPGPALSDIDNSGTLCITNEDTAMETVLEGISPEELTNGGAIEEVSRALVSNRTRAIQDTLLSSRRLRMGYHHGRLQVLPQKWTFPKMNVKQLVDNWYVGNKKERIPPFKLLEPLHVQHIGTSANKNAGRVKIRQMKCVMSQIEDYAKTEEVYEINPDKWTTEYTTKIWEAVGDKYINSKFRGNRAVEMSWKTLFNKMQKANMFKTSVNQ